MRPSMEKGITCMACGEPACGTLEQNAREKGMTDAEIAQVAEELNLLIAPASVEEKPGRP